MTEDEKKKMLLEYIALVGERTLKTQEMEKIERELGLTREEILELGKEIVLSDFEKKD